MSKHTPGPWERDTIEPWPAVIQTAYMDAHKRGQLTICTVAPQGPETEANARLIAAAPDLLIITCAAFRLLTAEQCATLTATEEEAFGRVEDVLAEARRAS